MTARSTPSRFRWYIALWLGFALAVSSFASSQEIAERPTEELLRYGTALYERGECFASRYLFQQVLTREPQNIEALSGKGRALVCEGSFDEGIAALAEVQKLAPEMLSAHTELVEAYLAQYAQNPEVYSERLSDARAALDKAEEAGGESAALDNLRGVVYYRQGDLDSARNLLLKAVNEDGEVADYQRNLGLVYLARGEVASAVTTLKRAVSLEPSDPFGRNQLGSAYLLSGDCEDAIFELEQAVNLEPNEAVINFNLGRAKFDCAQPEEARPYFEKVVALEPTAFAAAYTYLARVELEAGNLDRAVTQATKGALFPPANAEAYYWLGQAYEARDGTASDGQPDSDKARDAYNRALELDPEFSLAQEALDALP